MARDGEGGVGRGGSRWIGESERERERKIVIWDVFSEIDGHIGWCWDEHTHTFRRHIYNYFDFIIVLCII